jgi:hypothetical protein
VHKWQFGIFSGSIKNIKREGREFFFLGATCKFLGIANYIKILNLINSVPFSEKFSIVFQSFTEFLKLFEQFLFLKFYNFIKSRNFLNGYKFL